MVSYRDSYAIDLPGLVDIRIWKALLFLIIKVGEIWLVVIIKSPYVNFKTETTFVQKMNECWKNYASLGLTLEKTKEINR